MYPMLAFSAQQDIAFLFEQDVFAEEVCFGFEGLVKQADKPGNQGSPPRPE